jgi:hypothetical protein
MRPHTLFALCLLLCMGCATPSDPMSYRLGDTGEIWSDGEGSLVLVEVRALYPEFFDEVLDPTLVREPDMRPLRRDIEHAPVDRRNFDALHALAIAYYEYNYQAESNRGGDLYLANSMLTARIVAVPWRAYGEVHHAGLRDAMLDFFEDAASGQKLGSASTAPRLARIVGSLAKKEDDPVRHARIERIRSEIVARTPEMEGDR